MRATPGVPLRGLSPAEAPDTIRRVFVVAVIDEEGKPVTAVGPSNDRATSEQHRDKLRLPAGWTAHAIPLREPIIVDVDREVRFRRGG